MKKLLVRVVCLCLALVVALGSVGMAATEQICRMADPKKLATQAMADTCCAAENPAKPGNTKLKLSKKCCSVSTQHRKLETPAANKPAPVNIPVLLPAISEVAFGWNLNLPTDKVRTTDNNKSPPLFGTGLLKSLHEFRV